MSPRRASKMAALILAQWRLIPSRQGRKKRRVRQGLSFCHKAGSVAQAWRVSNSHCWEWAGMSMAGEKKSPRRSLNPTDCSLTTRYIVELQDFLHKLPPNLKIGQVPKVYYRIFFLNSESFCLTEKMLEWWLGVQPAHKNWVSISLIFPPVIFHVFSITASLFPLYPRLNYSI